MSSAPLRIDLSPDSGGAGDPSRWRARLDAMLAAPPGWLELQAARVAKERLAAFEPGPALVLGIGGSALGPRALVDRAAQQGAAHRVRVLDSLDGAIVEDALSWAIGVGARAIVISKSGRTREVVELLKAATARGVSPGAFVSDPGGGSPISELVAAAGGYLRFELPAEVGGRWSALTSVGQVPLHATGTDAHAALDGAMAQLDRLRADADALLQTLAWRAAHPATTKVIWSYSEALLPWAAWLQQLECESLGRDRGDERVGEMVAVLRGPADQHSVAQLLLDGPRDKRILIVDFSTDPVAADLRAVSALRAIERDAVYDVMRLPTQRMLVTDRSVSTLGALMLQCMVSTVLWAEHLDVDPYGQPAVEAIKTRVAALLDPKA
jgi:glucose-6-phosphate isomerase